MIKQVMTGIATLILVVSLVGCVGKSEYETLQTEYATLANELDTLSAEKRSLQDNYETLALEKATIENQNISLVAETLELETSLEIIESELTEIKKVYPLRNFGNYAELIKWIEHHFVDAIRKGNNTYSNHLKLQNMAQDEGYVWFIAYNPEYRRLGYFGTGTKDESLDYGPHAGSLVEDTIMPYANLHASVIVGNDIYSVYLNGEIIWVGLVYAKYGRYTDTTAPEPKFPPPKPPYLFEED